MLALIFSGLFVLVLYLAMFAIAIVTMIAQAKVLIKMGLEWWYIFIPIFPIWKQFEVLYGAGMGVNCLKMLIPFYGMHVMFKFYIELAKQFGQDLDFGLWLCVFPPYPLVLMGFKPEYQFIGQEAYEE